MLYSGQILNALKTALQGITLLGGSGVPPAEVRRFDAEKGTTRLLPSIRIVRLQEEHLNPGNADRLPDEVLQVAVPVEVYVFSRLDRTVATTYDELVEEDVEDVLKAIYAMDWDGLRANPLPVLWQTLFAEEEVEPEHGAVIRFTARYRSPRADLTRAVWPTFPNEFESGG